MAPKKPVPAPEPTPTGPPEPAGLDVSGRALWHNIADHYDLDELEQEQLAQAARQSDVVAALEAALAGTDLVVIGSQGQPRPSPLLVELRGHRALLDRLLARLKLPQETTPESNWRSENARTAARARWSS